MAEQEFTLETQEYGTGICLKSFKPLQFYYTSVYEHMKVIL
jgi:hypothetical protein